MHSSENTSKLVSALALAQAKFDKIVKDRVGQEGNLKFHYSDLPTVLAAILPHLNGNGIFLSQPIVNDPDGTPRVTTRLQLNDEWIQSDGIRLTNQVAGKQLGKEITYGRRIDLCSFLSLVGEDDDDAPDLSKPKVEYHANKVPATLPKNSGTTLKVNDPALAKTKDDPIPSQMYEDVPTIIRDNPLPEDARKTAEEMENFVPLTEKRNQEIQDRLKELVANRTVDRRKLSVYLDKQHEGKKSFEVSATQWESTMKKIEDAITQGAEAVKTLLKGE